MQEIVGTQGVAIEVSRAVLTESSLEYEHQHRQVMRLRIEGMSEEHCVELSLHNVPDNVRHVLQGWLFGRSSVCVQLLLTEVR